MGQGDTILAKHDPVSDRQRNAHSVRLLAEFHRDLGLAMQQLDSRGYSQERDVNLIPVADDPAPNGGLLSRFDGFNAGNGSHHVDPLNLPSLGISFDGATPSSDYATQIYTIEYDGFADFPKYPLNFLSDLNAFLGIQSLHGTYLNGGDGTGGLGSGPSLADIAHATRCRFQARTPAPTTS